MPQNDLIRFQRLAPDGCTLTPHNQNKISDKVPSWEAAVALLWEATRPRIIVYGGNGFNVVSGPALALEANPTYSPEGPRLEIYMFIPDEDDDAVPVPRLGAGLEWMSALPTLGYEQAPFPCYIVSARDIYNHIAGPRTPWGFFWMQHTAPSGGGSHANWDQSGSDDHLWQCTITNAASQAVPGNVPTRTAPHTALKTGGRVDVRLARGRNGEVIHSQLAVYRCVGNTRLSLGASGWDRMAYGWVFADPNPHRPGRIISVYGEMNRLAYLGCFPDRNRPLNGIMNDTDKPKRYFETSVAGCKEAVANFGRRLFSLQSGNECRIGENDDASGVVATGDNPDACGVLQDGSNVGAAGINAAYILDRTTQQVSLEDRVARYMPRQPITIEYGGKQHTIVDRGCWQDFPEPNRIMGGGMGDGYGWNTVPDCAIEAAVRGMSFFGMQNGSECWIPKNTWSIAEHTVPNSGPITRGCQERGMPWGMHTYSMGKDTINSLRAVRNLPPV